MILIIYDSKSVEFDPREKVDSNVIFFSLHVNKSTSLDFIIKKYITGRLKFESCVLKL